MAMTGTITASATAVAAGEPVKFGLTISNSGASDVSVTRIEGFLQPLDTSVRLGSPSVRCPVTVAASGSATINVGAIGHKAEPFAVQSPFSFYAHFSVTCGDGTRIELDSPYVLVGPANDGVLGAARFDGPLTQLAPALVGV